MGRRWGGGGHQTIVIHFQWLLFFLTINETVFDRSGYAFRACSSRVQRGRVLETAASALMNGLMCRQSGSYYYHGYFVLHYFDYFHSCVPLRS